MNNYDEDEQYIKEDNRILTNLKQEDSKIEAEKNK